MAWVFRWLLRMALLLMGAVFFVSLLAAAAVALVLLRIFSDNTFFKTLFDWVVEIFTRVAEGL